MLPQLPYLIFMSYWTSVGISLMRHSLGEPGLLVGTEPHQDINAGVAIFPGTEDSPKPGTLRRKVMTARRSSLEKPRVDLPATLPALVPPVSLSERQFRASQSAVTHAQHLQMAALTHFIGRNQGWELQGPLGGVGRFRNLDMHYGLAYTK